MLYTRLLPPDLYLSFYCTPLFQDLHRHQSTAYTDITHRHRRCGTITTLCISEVLSAQSCFNSLSSPSDPEPLYYLAATTYLHRLSIIVWLNVNRHRVLWIGRWTSRARQGVILRRPKANLKRIREGGTDDPSQSLRHRLAETVSTSPLRSLLRITIFSKQLCSRRPREPHRI